MAPREGKLMLLDGHSLLYRAFHALPTMTTSTGQHTNAVYGFANMLMRLLDDEKPNFAAVAFDRSAPTFRHTTFEAYKANRPPMADELRSQIPLIHELVEAFNLSTVELDGYEADDVLGTLACQGEAFGQDVIIVTGDKDALQLVRPGITVLITRKGITEMERYDAAKVEERFGIHPAQVVDLKALMGDVSDNIPGVAGIGEKTAARLLREYGTLESILEHVNSIKGKVGEALRSHYEDAILSRTLATIDCSAPVQTIPESLKWHLPDTEQLSSLFTKIEARSLLNQLLKRYPPKKTESLQDGLFFGEPNAISNGPSSEIAGLPGISDNSAEVSRTPFQMISAMEWIKKVDTLQEPIAVSASFRSETIHDQTCVLVVAADQHVCYAADGVALPDYMKLITSGRLVTSHDIKSQLVAAAQQGCTLPEPEQVHALDDLQVASYLINPSQGDHSLADLAIKHGFGPPTAWPKDTEPNSRDDAWQQSVNQRMTLLQTAHSILTKRLDQDQLTPLYKDLEMPLSVVLAHMEHTGIAIDRERLAGMSVEMAAETNRLTQAIYSSAGEEFNINSPRQLAKILFEKLQLPVHKATKTGPSTAAEVLEELAAEHELPRLLLDYRQLVKLTGTYVDALPQQIHPETGRIHTTFNQTVAATGRLSSTNPNLQNIPVRTALGRQIRGAFVPGSPGWKLISADYSQIELRVLAHLSQDQNLLSAFHNDTDIHTKTASEVFNVDLADVTPDMRSDAKAINFGIVYGISSFGLARGTGLSRSEAQAYIKGYFAHYPGVKQYMEDSVASGKAMGYVTTLLGRRRYLPDLNSRRWQERSFAERTAMNTPIQGSAADIIKLAMIMVHQRLRNEGLRTRMLLQVHDELLLEAPEEELRDAIAIVREEMETAFPLDIPLKVDIGAGSNWLDIEEYAQ